MSPFQIAALIFVAAFPLACKWGGWGSGRSGSGNPWPERTLAIGLLLAYCGDVTFKIIDRQFQPAFALPLQLCDWALFAIILALLFRWQTAFDLAYFWGLAGTLQALFTPAIASDLFWMRQAGFFFIHAGIVAGVFHLVFNGGFRPRWPRSLVRIVVASEIYLLTALSINRLTGGNYGFLSHKPIQRSMLDWFSDQPAVYALQLNLTAFVFFALLYLPWWWVDWRRETKVREVPRT